MRGDCVIADADTTWALVNIDNKSLIRQEDIDIYSFENEPAVTLDIPLRLRFPRGAELESVGSRRIVYSDLDYNMHMNNTRYADMLCDFMPLEDVPAIKGMSLSYLHEAAFGDVIKIYAKKSDGRYSFRTVNQNGITCLEAEVLI
jgi:acyl-ACP thioesterase